MLWFFYSILAYAVIAVTNITDKVLVEKYIKDSSIIVIFSGTIAFLVGLGLILFVGIPSFTFFQLVRVIVAGMFLQYYMLPYFKSLERDDPSLVVPLFQAIPIFTLLLSWMFLGERLIGSQLFGFLFILAGGLLISGTKKGALKPRKTFWLMMFSSLLFSFSSILFKGVVNENNLLQTIAVESLGIGVGTLLLFLIPGYGNKTTKIIKKMPKIGWGALATSEIFYVVYRFLILTAFSIGSVAIVSVLSGIQSVFVLVYEIVLTLTIPRFFHENLDKKIITQKVVAFGLMLVGLWFIYA